MSRGRKDNREKNENCFADTQPIIYKPLKFQSLRQIVKQVWLDWLERKRLAKKDFSLRSFFRAQKRHGFIHDLFHRGGVEYFCCVINDEIGLKQFRANGLG
jgi:hypothetical protein